MSRRPGRWQLIRVAAPMAVWVLHLLLVYSLVGLACAEGWPTRRIAGLPMLVWVMLAATAAALALIAGLGWRARRAWRALPAANEAALPAAARRRFTSRATAVIAVVAAIAVAFTSAPMFSLPPCL
jgi:hypothetical protein